MSGTLHLVNTALSRPLLMAGCEKRLAIGRLVRYRTDDLNAFIEQRAQHITNYDEELI